MRDHASRVIAAQRSQRSLAAGPAQYLIAAVVTIEEDIVACHGKAECRCAGQEQQQQRRTFGGRQWSRGKGSRSPTMASKPTPTLPFLAPLKDEKSSCPPLSTHSAILSAIGAEPFTV